MFSQKMLLLGSSPKKQCRYEHLECTCAVTLGLRSSLLISGWHSQPRAQWAPERWHRIWSQLQTQELQELPLDIACRHRDTHIQQLPLWMWKRKRSQIRIHVHQLQISQDIKKRIDHRGKLTVQVLLDPHVPSWQRRTAPMSNSESQVDP